jgi:hypothetical protein
MGGIMTRSLLFVPTGAQLSTMVIEHKLSQR